MSILIVETDSINGNVFYSTGQHENIVSLQWKCDDDQIDIYGFDVSSLDILNNFYKNGFYTLDEVSVVQFIMNLAKKVCRDLDLEKVTYKTVDDIKTEIPVFLPFSALDDMISILPYMQIELCEMWSKFKGEFEGYLDADLVMMLNDKDLLVPFLDLVNVELSLLEDYRSKE